MRVLFVAVTVYALAGSALIAAAQSANQPLPDDLASARKAVQQADWPQAERLARRYLSEHASSPEGHYLLAFALFRENKPEASLAEYTHAAVLRKPAALDLRWVALDYVLLGDYGDADKWITKSIEWDGHDGNAWYEMGRIKYQENRFAEAVNAFQNALQRIPKLVKAENNLGLAYEGLNEPDKAIAAYQQAITWQAGLTQKSEQPLLNLGSLYLDQGRITEALPLLIEAETIVPGDGKIHATLGKLYLRQGNLVEAQASFEKAAAIDPASAPIHFQLGQTYRKEGKTEQAQIEFAKAAQIDGASSLKGH